MRVQSYRPGALTPSLGRNKPRLVAIIGTRRAAHGPNALPPSIRRNGSGGSLAGRGDGVLRGGYARTVIRYVTILAAMGLATFVAFWLDKRRAVRGDHRIPERTLHAMELLGGWAGAIAAMLLVRHKNRKASYWVVTALIAAVHVATAAWLLFR